MLNKQSPYLINNKRDYPCNGSVIDKSKQSVAPTSRLLNDSHNGCQTWHINKYKYHKTHSNQRRKIRLSGLGIYLLQSLSHIGLRSLRVAAIKHPQCRNHSLFSHRPGNQRHCHFPIKSERLKNWLNSLSYFAEIRVFSRSHSFYIYTIRGYSICD